MNVKGWNAYGSYERRQLTFKTIDFLRKALSYAEEFLQLSEEIFHPSTAAAVIKVLPEGLFNKIKYLMNINIISTQAVNIKGKGVLLNSRI